MREKGCSKPFPVRSAQAGHRVRRRLVRAGDTRTAITPGQARVQNSCAKNAEPLGRYLDPQEDRQPPSFRGIAIEHLFKKLPSDATSQWIPVSDMHKPNTDSRKHSLQSLRSDPSARCSRGQVKEVFPSIQWIQCTPGATTLQSLLVQNKELKGRIWAAVSVRSKPGCVTMTQSKLMLWLAFLLAALSTPPAFSQSDISSSQPEEFRIYNEHPRLLVNSRRLRLLRRERERNSIRWEQFHTLIAGKVEMPEKGFALGLYFLASGEEAYARQAIQWALGPATDLRQIALVFDWCHPELTQPQTAALIQKMRKLMDADKRETVAAVRSRVLAAAALAGHDPELQERILKSVWEGWWMGKIVPAIRADRRALARQDGYALMEILHVVRDNLNFDMRDNALKFFKDFSLHRILTYYPAVYPAAENQYRIPMYSGSGEPSLDVAALSRAADLSIVAFDTNALEHQFLQGWLIQDRFLMRGPYGIPYEFLWANPYQPGLSYHHLPKFFHDPQSGVLLLRSSWEEDATWLSYNRGDMELFMDGRRSGLRPSAIAEPLAIGEHVIMVGVNPMQWSLTLPETTRYFILGFKPDTYYEMEVDDEELAEVKTDIGGVLALIFPASSNVGVRIRESVFRASK